jgi:hypothetical protein
MSPVALKKRERQATPDFNTHDSSIGDALVNALSTTSRSLNSASKTFNKMADTKHQQGLNEQKRTALEAKAEEERVTKLLQNPLLTPAESRDLADSSDWSLAQVAAKNNTGALLAQEVYADMALAMDEAADTVEAREILSTYMGRALEGVEHPAERDGVIQRFADFAPQFLEKAAQTRIARNALNESIKTDALLATTLEAQPDSFITTVDGAVADAFVTKVPVTQVVDKAILSLSNFYDSGNSPDGELNPNESVVLEQLDAMLDSPLTKDSGNRKRALALRDSIYGNIESRLSSVKGVEDDEAREAFVAAQVEALDLIHAGRVVPDEVYKTLVTNARTDGEFARVEKLADNLNAPGLSGTAESREIRSNMRTGIEADIATGKTDTWDGESLQAATSFYDKGVRRLQQIEDPHDRYVALEALADEARRRALTAHEDSEKRREKFDAQQAKFDMSLQGLMDLDVPDDQIDKLLDDAFDLNWVSYQKQDYIRSLEKWARANGIELKDLDL